MEKMNDEILEKVSGGMNLGNLTTNEREQLMRILDEHDAVVLCDNNGVFGEDTMIIARQDVFHIDQREFNGIPYIVAYGREDCNPLWMTRVHVGRIGNIQVDGIGIHV